MAGLLQAPLRDFANLVQALIDDKGGVPDSPAGDDATAEPAAEPDTTAAPAPEAVTDTLDEAAPEAADAGETPADTAPEAS